MKKNIFMKQIAFILISSILIAGISCKKKKVEIGNAESSLQGIQAHWELVKATTIDEKSPSRSSFDMTDFYTDNGTKLPNITFNSELLTFSCDTVGLAINHIGTSGTWKFDDADFPSSITISDANNGMSVLKLYGPIRPSDAHLKIGKTLYCDDGSGGLIASYTLILEFERK
jgi:hypothetical protein